MTRIIIALVLASGIAAEAVAEVRAGRDIPVADFFKHPEFTEVVLSLDGKHIAVTVPRDDRTLLAVLRVSDMKVIGTWDRGANQHIQDIFWVNNERLIYRVAEKTGSLDFRTPTADMFATNIDGRRQVDIPNGNTYQVIKRVNGKPTSVWVQRSIDQAFLFELDTHDGRTITRAMAPLDRGSFLLDHDDNIRYAVGEFDDGRFRTLRRVGDDWEVVQTSTDGDGRRIPLGYDADNQRVAFMVSDAGEPPRIVMRNPETGEETLLSNDGIVEPFDFVTSGDRKSLLAVAYMPDRPYHDIIADDHPEAKVVASLIASFPDMAVEIGNFSEDGNRVIFTVSSDRDPGAYYLYDRAQGTATFLLANRAWIKPDEMSPMHPLTVKARDGLELRGYLTLPRDAEPKGLPMVMLVHGGPHGPRDTWGFDPEAQFLASRGYAVMQLNYRGSGGYGQKFMTAGYKQWGTTMQDDLADAVRWIAAEGIVDRDRVCIYGGSYGGYAALMQVVRYPDLYRCTIGYVGVYSLPMMFTHGDIPDSEAGRNFQKRILPDTLEEQQAQSAGYNVDKIKVPIMLVHGARDERVPIQQYRFLMGRLKDAGKEPEDTIVESKEGHGFYDLDNRVRMYTRLQRFLDRHIGSRD